ncbi:hypothetical protein ABIE67_007848 [Streptomyces sp. V4I8]|uniref:hypothetical protein n=1 Tax=Streptomyces sp. V4I8 TaxID=3156469 RepID=UPI003519A8BF
MSTTSPTIPPDVAAHVLFHYGREGGYQAGSFTTALLSAMGTADPTNLGRLAAGFPEYVAAVTAIHYDPNGVERLQDLAAGRCIRCKKDDGPNTPAGLCEPCARPMPLDGVA